MRTEPYDDGVTTRAATPLERVVVRGTTPRPGAARTPPRPKTPRK